LAHIEARWNESQGEDRRRSSKKTSRKKLEKNWQS
jgi:hypothetical protein